MTGTRRLYYTIFIGVIFVAVHDLIKELSVLSTTDIIMYTVLPLAISIMGVIYFKSFYLSSLKRS